MRLLQLLKQEIKEPIIPLLGLVIIVGLANTFLVELISSAAENVDTSTFSWKKILFVVIYIGGFLWAKKFIVDKSAFLVEDVVTKVRYRIAHKIRQVELSTLEDIGQANLYARVTRDTLDISHRSVSFIEAGQDSFILLFMFLYIFIISPWSAIIVLLGMGLGLLNFVKDENLYVSNMKELALKETDFFRKFSNILSGFKEIRINTFKNNDVFSAYAKVNELRKRQRIKTNDLYTVNTVMSQGFFYMTLAFIVFVLPQYQEAQSEILIKVVIAVLFIIGAVESILFVIANLNVAEQSATDILALEMKIDKALKKQQKRQSVNADTSLSKPLAFNKSIRLENLSYEYNSSNTGPAFSIGPMSLTFKKGEIIFIIGGNGSGKSTFLKMFTGLYMPKSGNIFIDFNPETNKKGIVVSAENHEAYRALFTTIFTDYHLFDKLYGLENIEDEMVRKLMHAMELPQEKTTYQNGGFTNIKLSSGQKKRLALVTCLLEDKDIYIFDEVAADLDPWFRDTYYYKILGRLKAKQKTVFVVSHDTEYWKIADRVLEVRNGQIYELSKEERTIRHFNKDDH